MNTKICCVFNLAPHYHSSIYKLKDKQLKCDFYIGNRIASNIKLMDYNELMGFKKTLNYIPFLNNFYFQKGAVSLVFKSYSHYIITGEPHCLSTWIILIFAKLLRKKTFVWTHGWYGDEGFLKKIIKKIFFAFATRILLYGEYARDLMINEGFNGNKLICIYNSLNYEEQIEIREKLTLTSVFKEHFKNENPVLLYIGRIQSVKKIDILLNSMNQLNKKGTILNLVIIGEEVDGISIVDIKDHFSLDENVWIYGPCYNEAIIGELIYNADICVSPGNVGLTAMHSLVYGTPVITHNNFKNQMPEFEAIEPGITGDFFIEDSVNDLSQKILEWIALSSDQRELVRQQCYKLIHTKYNPLKQIEVLKRLFINITP